MSAIYQRSRPITWEQVVGQEQVKDVLRGALEQGRVGHAYLFSGPRGVGKTTTARLIAMTANCQREGKKPCGECESCLSVRAGNHPDVLEIDAASNNSVDDVRDLREKVGLAAMRGGKKIYILDEAHMMSRAAFNALLKTLEEPPEHVIFILATTEPEKILPTIMSRCQHYRFRRLTEDEIAGKLQGLAQQEGVQADTDALHLIGRLADGAMRDGESLLERMLASGEAVTRQGVEHALGLPPSEQMRGMAQSLVQQDAATLLEGAAQMYRGGFAARTVVEGLVTALGEALHAELGLGSNVEEVRLEGAEVPTLLRLQAALDEQSSRFARAADQQSLELALTHALMAAQTGGSAPVSASTVAPRAATTDTNPELLNRLSKLERELSALRAGGMVQGMAQQVAQHAAPQASLPASPTQTQAQLATPVRASQPAPRSGGGNWADVMQRASIQMRAFLKPARMHAEAGYVSLSYDAKGKFHAKQVYEKFDDIGALVLGVFGAVTFELISPEHNRKQALGGARNVAAAEAAPQSAPQPQSAAPAERPTPQASAAAAITDLPDFEPARRAPAPRAPAPPLDDLPPFEPTPRPAAAASRLEELPDFEPVRRSQPANNPATAGKVMPPTLSSQHSPDDIAAAPLPEPQASAQHHAADIPPEPTESGPPPLEGTPGGPEVYIPAEPLGQEPDWDDLPPLDFEAAGTVTAAPVSAPINPPHSNSPQPRPAPRPVTSGPISGPGAAIRNHPNFQEVTRLFSGRIKEVGEAKKAVVAAEEEVQEEEVGMEA